MYTICFNCRLPPPSLPNFSIVPEIAVDGLIISLIAYIGSLSMALIFANKFKYEVNANQELFAQVCNNKTIYFLTKKELFIFPWIGNLLLPGMKVIGW